MEGKPSKDSALKIIGERIKKVTVFVKMWIMSETKFYLLVFVLLAVHFVFFFCIVYISPSSEILISFKISVYYWFRSCLTLPTYISINSIELLLCHILISLKSDTIILKNLCQTGVPVKWCLINFHFHYYFWGCTFFCTPIAIPVS